MFYFDSPDQGWDGKYRGKYVDPGVLCNRSKGGKQ